MNEIISNPDGGILDFISGVLKWIVDTEVSLGVVILLLLIGVIKEGATMWFTKGNKND